MTQQKSRKQRTIFTVEQKLDYAKLMANKNYTNRHIMEISGAGPLEEAIFLCLLGVQQKFQSEFSALYKFQQYQE